MNMRKITLGKHVEMNDNDTREAPNMAPLSNTADLAADQAHPVPRTVKNL